jgi:Flagellar transcriptional activator (FlhC)
VPERHRYLKDEEIYMRLTDDRYTHERRQLETAIRMIRYEARTNTIRACTGLTDDRVRKLYKSYVEHRHTTGSVRRKRGKSPQHIDSILRNAGVHQQASLLAGTFVAIGLYGNHRADRTKEPDLSLGEKLCDAYDFYLQLPTANSLSFEHAWFLWQILNQRDEIEFNACHSCGGLVLRDRYSVRTRACPWCKDKRQHSNLLAK